MFSFPLLRGERNGRLSSPGSIVVSRDLARKLFGGADPMGKAVIYKNRSWRYDLTVSGISKLRRQLLRHRFAPSSLRRFYQPAYRQRKTTVRLNLHWHLIGSTPNATRLNLKQRSHIFNSLL
jgi:hypothetical protein